MAKIKNLIWCVFILCISHPAGISQTRISEIYLSQLGVREATGHNDGKAVEMYLKSVKVSKGAPWCAAFVHWCLDSAKIKNSITAWSPTAHNKKHVVYGGRQLIEEPKSGDVFTLWFPKMGRIAHTGFYHRRVNSSVYESVEGNTSEKGARDGDGVYRRYRSYKATYSITRWP